MSLHIDYSASCHQNRWTQLELSFTFTHDFIFEYNISVSIINYQLANIACLACLAFITHFSEAVFTATGSCMEETLILSHGHRLMGIVNMTIPAEEISLSGDRCFYYLTVHGFSFVLYEVWFMCPPIVAQRQGLPLRCDSWYPWQHSLIDTCGSAQLRKRRLSMLSALMKVSL